MIISEMPLEGDALNELRIEDKVFVSYEYLAPLTGVETEWRQDPHQSYFGTVVGGPSVNKYLNDTFYQGGINVMRDPEEGASSKDANSVFPPRYIKPFVRVESFDMPARGDTAQYTGQVITRRTIRLAKSADEA